MFRDSSHINRHQIDVVAAKLFLLKGYKRTNLREIAYVLNCKPAVFKEYFKSKLELYVGILESELDQVYTRIEDEFQFTTSAYEFMLVFLKIRKKCYNQSPLLTSFQRDFSSNIGEHDDVVRYLSKIEESFFDDFIFGNTTNYCENFSNDEKQKINGFFTIISTGNLWSEMEETYNIEWLYRYITDFK